MYCKNTPHRCLMLKSLYIFCLFMLGSLQVWGQAQQSALMGRVLDEDTGEPLAGVHVFLSSRLQGTTTDSNGTFSIAPVAAGSYKVVASIIGYESASERTDVLEGENKRVPDLKLKPIVYELDAVQVTADQPRRWKRQLKRFNEYFLGTSENAKKSEIKNAYVLSFEEDRQTFKASASEPLKIENRGLGYTLTFVLDAFEQDEARGLRSTVGTWRFEELEPKNEKEANYWKQQREMTFKGSLQHLLWSMVHLRAEAEGYTLLRDLSEGAQSPELFLNRYSALDLHTILRKSEVPYEYKMAFDDFIRVYYLRTGDKVKLFGKRPPAEQLSYIKMNHDDEVTIHESGYMYTPAGKSGALTVFGYLASLGVADLLPQEFALTWE